MKPEIKNAILAIPNVNTVMVDGVESIVVDTCPAYEKVQEVLKYFDAEEVQEIPVYFDEEIWSCSGCNEWHKHETPIAMVHYGWCEQFCADAIEKLEDVHSAYIEYLTNNPKSCNLLGEEFLQKHGFVKMETHDVGMYGYEDGVTPKMALSKYAEHGENVIFNLDSKNPYSTKYSVWAEV